MISSRRGRALHRFARELDRQGVPGALVDCGVWNGGSTILLADGAPLRDVWAFDSFEGLPEPPSSTAPRAGWPRAWGRRSGCEMGLRATPPAERLHVVKGWFEDTFPAAPEIGPIALLHCRRRLVRVGPADARSFYDQVPPGGWVVIDDYGLLARRPGADRRVPRRGGCSPPVERDRPLRAGTGACPDGPARVLVWTETHVLGGCDRFLADLLPGSTRSAWRVALAGNPFPAFDAWLAERALGRARDTLPSPACRTHGSSAGARARRRGAAAPAAAAPPAARCPRGTLARRRRRRAAGRSGANFARLRRLLRRARPDVLLINNGGYPGAETCRCAALAARAEGVPRSRALRPQHGLPAVLAARASSARYDAPDRRAPSTPGSTAADRASDALAPPRGLPRAVAHGALRAPPAARPRARRRERPRLRRRRAQPRGRRGLRAAQGPPRADRGARALRAASRCAPARGRGRGRRGDRGAASPSSALADRSRFSAGAPTSTRSLPRPTRSCCPRWRTSASPTRSSRRWRGGCPSSRPTSPASRRRSTTARPASSSRRATPARWRALWRSSPARRSARTRWGWPGASVSSEFSLGRMVDATTALWGVDATARAPISALNRYFEPPVALGTCVALQLVK